MLGFGRGLQIDLPGKPEQAVRPGNHAASVAVFGGDYPGMRADLLVAEGDTVARGAPVFRDRKQPEMVITAPSGGQVQKIEIGARRRLSRVVIGALTQDAVTFDRPAPDTQPTRAAITDLMLQAGLWAGLRTRPFGRRPEPGSTPDAIFVGAMRTEPLAPGADVILETAGEDFFFGLLALKPLTEGPIFVCQGRGAQVHPGDGQIRVRRFGGPHPAGLPGTHIDRLFPVQAGRVVWQIDLTEVIALGHVMRTGTLPATQITALGGPGVAHARLIEAPPGAALDDLLHQELTDGQKRVLSGSPLTGREATHLRRGHDQVTVLDRAPARREGRWWPDHARALRPLPVVPTAALSHALGPDLAVVPLIRALSVGDAETADRLGARALLEDDMALVSYAAGGAQDFGALLRGVLDDLEAAP